MLNLGVEKHRKSTGFPRLGTNGTWLQLVRRCTFLLDPGVLISECRSVGMHQGFLTQGICATVQSYISFSNARMIEIKSRVNY